MLTGSGKTIKSGPDDNVFVYFADHGGPGLVAFPNGNPVRFFTIYFLFIINL